MRWKWFNLQTGLEVTCCCEKEQKRTTDSDYNILYCIVLYCIVLCTHSVDPYKGQNSTTKQLVTIVCTVNGSTADKVIHINIEIETKLCHLPHIAHLQQECHNSKFGICGLLA